MPKLIENYRALGFLMKRFIYFMCFLLCLYCLPQNLSFQTNATTQTTNEQLAIYQALLDLQFPYTIMCVAAHPDDEDSDALAYYRMKYGARTVLVTATRGEGGQNSQGPELYEDLAVIRAKETTAMARRLDTIPINLAMPDFGFSKSSEDTFKVWNRREALRRLVFAIRTFKPDIIITVHDRKTGHGHHQATRLLAEEAYYLAADRLSFVEQFTGLARLEPWQVKRLFARTLSKTKFDTEFDSNQNASVYNQPYSQFGYQSRLEHRTQGPWPQIELKGERMVRFNLIKSVDEDFRRWYLLWQGFPEVPIYNKIQPLIFDEQV
ncbi:MAG: LmbE family protein, partial [bacterium]